MVLGVPVSSIRRSIASAWIIRLTANRRLEPDTTVKEFRK